MAHVHGEKYADGENVNEIQIVFSPSKPTFRDRYSFADAVFYALLLTVITLSRIAKVARDRAPARE